MTNLGTNSHCEHKHGIKGSVKDVQLLQPEPKHVCSECSSSCVTFAGFLYHHMSHLNIKPFHCRFCTYTSNKKTNLTTHLEVSINDITPGCSTSGKLPPDDPCRTIESQIRPSEKCRKFAAQDLRMTPFLLMVGIYKAKAKV